MSDLNLAAFSLVIYALWFFLTAFSTSAVFGSPLSIEVEGSAGASNPAFLMEMMGLDFLSVQSTHAYVFLAVSAITLVIFGLIARRSKAFRLHRWYLVTAGVLGCIGVLLQMLFPDSPLLSMFAAGIVEGFSASIFIFLWGAIYTRFEFATSIVNASLAFAVGIVLAISLVNWLPTQVTVIIDALLPIATIPLLMHVIPTLGDEGLGQEIELRGNYKVVGYITRMMISLLLLGTLIGAMCVICGAFLLTSGNLAIELTLIGGCIVSCAVFVWAIAISRKETRWDSLFRYISPIIALGFCMLPLLLTDGTYIAVFFLALACICILSLTWVFLCNNARNLTSVPMASFAFGFALIQVGLIAGVVICKVVIEGALWNLIEGDSLLFADFAGLQTQSMVLALVLTALLFITYSVLPRYRELKTIMSSMLQSSLEPIPDADPGHAGKVASMHADDLDEGGVSASVAIDGDGGSIADGTVDHAGDVAGGAGGVAASAGDAQNVMDVVSDSSDSANDNSRMTATPKDAGTKGSTDKGSFKRRCDEISRAYLLSDREQEVMFLLAKGHNAAYILDKLCISRSTVKTHINHIYKKLDIHTQQELLNMVEDRQRGPIRQPEEHDRLVESARRLSAEGPVSASPTKLVQDIDFDVHSHRMQR